MMMKMMMMVMTTMQTDGGSDDCGHDDGDDDCDDDDDASDDENGEGDCEHVYCSLWKHFVCFVTSLPQVRLSATARQSRERVGCQNGLRNKWKHC